MRIRKATKTLSDYQAFDELYNSYHYPTKKKKTIFQVSQNRYYDMLDSDGYQHFFLEDQEKKIKGYAKIMIIDKKMFIDFFIIQKEQRGNGYGKEFFSLLEKQANKRQVKVVEVKAVTKEAQRFWKSQNFLVDFGKIFIKEL